MSRNFRRFILLTSVITVAAGASAADVSSTKDLLATIVLNGQSCDAVLSSTRNADSDYVATCKNGNRYRVYVNDKGRVVVQKL